MSAELWPSAARSDPAAHGRLTFEPPRPSASFERTGRFDMAGTPDAEPAAVYVPSDTAGEPLHLVVMLHGAGGVPPTALEILHDEAEQRRLLLVAPKSVGPTWDVLTGGYGPDVRNIDALLVRLAGRYPIRDYAVGGFSDGASYALSLGIANGDVFSAVIAFSPGFEAAQGAVGRPRIFVSHGTEDPVLPIDRCSRRIVPALEDRGYHVTYREFPDGHAIPPDIQRAAVSWLTEQA